MGAEVIERSQFIDVEIRIDMEVNIGEDTIDGIGSLVFGFALHT